MKFNGSDPSPFFPATPFFSAFPFCCRVGGSWPRNPKPAFPNLTMEGPLPPPKRKKRSGNVEAVPRVAIVQILAELEKEELLRILLDLELADDELVHMIAEAVRSHPDFAETVVKVADGDVRKRQVLVRGLGPQTTVEALHQVFSEFGSIEKTWIILEKGCNSGFVIFDHVTSMVWVPHQMIIDGVSVLTVKKADQAPTIPQPPTFPQYPASSQSSVRLSFINEDDHKASPPAPLTHSSDMVLYEPQRPPAEDEDMPVPLIQTQSRWNSMIAKYNDAMKVLPDDNTFSKCGLTKRDVVVTVYQRERVRSMISGLNYPGVQFCPTDYEMVTFFQPEQFGIELPIFFHHLDLYSIHPNELPGEYTPAPFSSELVWYVVTPLTAISGGKYSRVASGGAWRVNSEEDIYTEDNILSGVNHCGGQGKTKIGQKRMFAFFESETKMKKKKETVKKKTNWLMEEFTRIGEEEKAICRIKAHKD